MKYIAWILSLLNIYFGVINFLNVVHVLDDSKYSQGATSFFAILFLVMGVAGLYYALVKKRYRLALIIEVGPWILALLFLLLNMLTRDYR